MPDREPATCESGATAPFTLKRIGLTAATAFAAINIWTGCPSLALWVAPQVSSEHRITMPAVGVFLITVALLEGVTITALAWLAFPSTKATPEPPEEAQA
jgi:hypothetical protein